jgi:predicted short-subunit dehydrogenase-like oxidoreductase (DUF2520 family)
MSCGYLVALLKAAASTWPYIGLTEAEGLAAVLPLAKATLENTAALGADGAVTGPMVRGDVSTLNNHLRSLQARIPSLMPLYLALSEASLSLAAPKVSGEQLQAMRGLLEEYSRGLPTCKGTGE